MRYGSLFSGIGGLEHPNIDPVFLCEKDPKARIVLALQHPGVPLYDDVRTLPVMPLDVVIGGWPCQDISLAGRKKGITGSRSCLFFDMVSYAKACGAHTIIGENVSNLRSIHKGEDFWEVVRTFHRNGFTFVSWRLLDARECGLPQSRRRLIFVASQYEEISRSIHRPVHLGLDLPPQAVMDEVYGFMSGAGAHDHGGRWSEVPTVKTGDHLAVYYSGKVYKVTPESAMCLQGFDPAVPLNDTSKRRVAGNAVARPMGVFAMGSLSGWDGPIDTSRYEGGPVPKHGISGGSGHVFEVCHDTVFRYCGLLSFLGDEPELSPQASAGSLVRTFEHGRKLPREVLQALWRQAQKGATSVVLTKAAEDSFVKLARYDVAAEIERAAT